MEPSARVCYERSASGIVVYVHTLHPEKPDTWRAATYNIEVWHNLTLLRPLESAGLERLYRFEVAKGDTIGIDCFMMPRREFGPRARLDVISGDITLTFAYLMAIDIQQVVMLEEAS